jgi:hypothetical protein
VTWFARAQALFAGGFPHHTSCLNLHRDMGSLTSQRQHRDSSPNHLLFDTAHCHTMDSHDAVQLC